MNSIIDLPAFKQLHDLFQPVMNAESINVIAAQLELVDNQPLGRRFEQIIQALIEASPHLELLASNVQLIDQISRTTWGELDFVIKNKQTQQIQHLEVACKFYLYHGAANTAQPELLNDFIGPNKQDRLGDKTSLMLNKQLCPPKHLLSQYLDVTIDEHSALMLGYVFVPLKFVPLNHAPPLAAEIHPQASLGFWLTLEQLAHLPDEIFILSKNQWLIGCSEQLLDKKSAIAIIQTALINNKQPIQVSDIHNNRYFILNNDWL